MRHHSKRPELPRSLALEHPELCARRVARHLHYLLVVDAVEEPRELIRVLAAGLYPNAPFHSTVRRLSVRLTRQKGRSLGNTRGSGPRAAGRLQAPQFLYLLEQRALPAEPTSTSVGLTGHELASRLSYFLWNTMPDQELLQAAESGTLAEVSALEAQARRMMASPRARAAFVEDAFWQQGMAGSGGGYFKMGRLLQLPRAGGVGPAHDDLFVSLANCMGLDVTTFGNAEVCRGPLPGLRA
jgi:hypothetical protein